MVVIYNKVGWSDGYTLCAVLKRNGVQSRVINIDEVPLTRRMILKLARMTEDQFDNLIMDKHKDILDMPVLNMVDLLISDPRKYFRLPIAVDYDRRIVRVGMKEDAMEVFYDSR